MRVDLGVDAAAAGLIGSSAYVSYLVANAAVVPLTARVGPRLPLALGTVSAVAGMTLLGVATSAAAMLLGVLLAGASAGFCFPPYADVVPRAIAPRRQATAWAAISSGTGWGVALAGTVVVASGASWRASWLLFAAVALVVGAVAVVSAPTGPWLVDGPVVRLRPRWFVCPRSGPLLASSVAVGAGSSVWWSFSVDAMRAADVDASTARLVYAVGGLTGVLATLAGMVVARSGLRRVHRWSVLALTGSLTLLAIGSTGSPTLVALLVAAGLFGMSYNGVIAVQGLWSGEVFAERPSAGLAAVSTALTAGTLVGPALGGWLITLAGYGTALGAASVAVALAYLLAPPRRTTPERPDAAHAGAAGRSDGREAHETHSRSTTITPSPRRFPPRSRRTTDCAPRTTAARHPASRSSSATSTS